MDWTFILHASSYHDQYLNLFMQALLQGYAAGCPWQKVEYGVPGERDRLKTIPSQIYHRKSEGWYPQGTKTLSLLLIASYCYYYCKKWKLNCVKYKKMNIYPHYAFTLGKCRIRTVNLCKTKRSKRGNSKHRFHLIF